MGDSAFELDSFMLDVDDRNAANRDKGKAAVIDLVSEDEHMYDAPEYNPENFDVEQLLKKPVACARSVSRTDIDTDNDDGPTDFDPLSPKKPVQPSPATKRAQKAALRTMFDENNAFTLNEDGHDFLPHKHSSRVPGTFRRTNRVVEDRDQLAPYHKRISHILDSDDELMINMREKGYTDQQIADRLVREGRVRYDRKSVGTRILRIKQAQAAHVDTLLESGFKEWEHEDDILLMQAYELADVEIQYEIERVRAWRFRKVADQMRRLNVEAIFSPKACKDRWMALLMDEAAIPSALDDNPEERLLEIEKQREEYMHNSMAEAEEKEKRDEQERRINEELRMQRAEKAKETAERRAAKQEEKAARAMKRAAESELKLRRAHENKKAKIAKAEMLRLERAQAARRAHLDRIRNNPNRPITVNPVVMFENVTKDTPDPRSYLSVADLKMLCRQRGLPPVGRSKAEVLNRLRNEDEVCTLNELKSRSRSKGLNTAGTKVQLAYQLALAEARTCPSWEVGEDSEADDDDQDLLGIEE